MTILKRIAALSLAALLLGAAGCGSTSTRESTGEYFDDSVITTKVKAAIFNEPDLKVLQIRVDTYKNVVDLSGFVASSGQVTKAVDLARSVQGVQSVVNRLLVK
jgi:osmotically-inducible protein OsmY